MSKNTKGFTLIELLMAVAVVSVTVASAGPNMVDFVLNNRAATQINELQTSLSLARNEAIKRNRNITVCQSSNGTDCSGDWQNGWIVFVDNDFDGTVDADDQILRVHDEVTDGSMLISTQSNVTYAKTGIARSGSNGSFVLCDSRGVESSTGLVVGPSGRPRIATENDLQGILTNENAATSGCS